MYGQCFYIKTAFQSYPAQCGRGLTLMSLHQGPCKCNAQCNHFSEYYNFSESSLPVFMKVMGIRCNVMLSDIRMLLPMEHKAYVSENHIADFSSAALHLAFSLRSLTKRFDQMGNGLHLYSTFLLTEHSKTLYRLMPQTSTHSHTNGRGYCLRSRPAHREQLVRCLAQGHSHTW